jgi:hypothetical protein
MSLSIEALLLLPICPSENIQLLLVQTRPSRCFFVFVIYDVHAQFDTYLNSSSGCSEHRNQKSDRPSEFDFGSHSSWH